MTELATGPEELTFKMQIYTAAGRGKKTRPEPILQNSTFMRNECAQLLKHMWAYMGFKDIINRLLFFFFNPKWIFFPPRHSKKLEKQEGSEDEAALFLQK